jgi:hypothetical protein
MKSKSNASANLTQKTKDAILGLIAAILDEKSDVITKDLYLVGLVGRGSKRPSDSLLMKTGKTNAGAGGITYAHLDRASNILEKRSVKDIELLISKLSSKHPGLPIFSNNHFKFFLNNLNYQLSSNPKYQHRLIANYKTLGFASTPEPVFNRYCFDPSPIPTPTWDEIIDRVINPSALMGFFGSLFLDGEIDRVQWLNLSGPGGSGKSALMHFMQTLLTDEMCLTVDLETLESEYFPASLENKKLVYIKEYGKSKFHLSDLFKGWTGDDRISVREIYEPWRMIDLECSFMMASEHPPKMDESDGSARRALLCRMTRLKKEHMLEKNELQAKLLAEAPGIIYQCISVARQYNVKGKLVIAENELLVREAINKTIVFHDEFESYFDYRFKVVPGAMMPRERLHEILQGKDRLWKSQFKDFLQSKGLHVQRVQRNGLDEYFWADLDIKHDPL